MRAFLKARLQRRSWQAILGVLALCLVAIWIFNRNYHFHFDAHHRDEKSSFFDWCAGWFKDWGRGPLYAVIVEGPKADPFSALSREHYGRLLRKFDASGEILYFSDEYHGLTFGLSWCPATRKVIAYSVPRSSVTTLHQSNDWADSIPFDAPVSVDRKTYSWMAVNPTDWEWARGSWSITLGTGADLPAGREIEEWAFIFKSSDRSTEAEVLIAFDRDRRKWRIFDREYREQIEINSWLEHIGKY